MKKNKLIAISVIFILLFAMIPSFFGSAKTIENNDKIILKAIKSKIVNPLEIKNINYKAQGNSEDDLLVSDDPGDELYPSIAVDNEDVVVGYEYKYELNNSVRVKQSDDFGLTFSNDILSYENSSHPSFTNIRFNGKFFGAFLSTINSSLIYELTLPGSGSAEEWDYSNITDSEDNHIGRFFNFKNPDVSMYQDTTINWIIATIGDGDFIEGYESFECEQSPIFFYKDIDNPSGSRTIVFFPEVSNCNNISVCLGENQSDTPTIFGVCEQKDGDENDLLFFHGNPDVWTSEDLLRKDIVEYSEDIYNPKIASVENNIYVVATTESDEIVLFHSDNYGIDGSWNVLDVTENLFPSNAEPNSPDIYVENSNILLTYVNDSNLYRLESSDDGGSWTDFERVNNNNDSVVAGFKNSEIGDFDRIIWTDDREKTNTDLYMDIGYSPSIDLNISDFSLTSDRPFLKTNNYLVITVKNDGNVDFGDDLVLNVSYEKSNGNITKIDYPFIIGGLQAGEEKTIKRRFIEFSNPEYFEAILNLAGITNITVKIDSESIPTQDLNPVNNIKTKSIEYKDIFPILGKSPLLETILKIITKIIDFF